MKKILTILVDGFEETEALFPIDLMRRVGIEVLISTPQDTLEVVSSHGVKIIVEKKLTEINFDEFDGVFLPGGPGTKKYYEYDLIKEIVVKMFNDKKLVSAICAAPSYLAKIGVLKGLNATAYTGFEKYILENGGSANNFPVIVDENVITGRSVAASKDFGLEIVKYLLGNEISNKLKIEIINY